VLHNDNRGSVAELDRQIEETLKNLKLNNFDANFVQDRNAAKDLIFSSIAKNVVVGISDSATVRQIGGIAEQLEKTGITVLNPFSRELTTDPAKTEIRDNLSRQIFSCDVLIAGTNAVTRDGKLVNVDATGNRVASMIFGPRKVFILVGKNKIVKNVDEALYRIKNLIAPFHAKTKQFATPCAKTGKCVDCGSARRICSVTTIMEKKPWRTEITVILINEDLGLSWDETWSIDRISRIKANYENVTWVFASAKTT
jgi:hypothetical protein